MITSRRLRIWAAVFLNALGLIVVVIFITSAPWWIRASCVVVTCSKSACPEARVYKSWGGDVLVSIDDYDWYLVFPQSQRIGKANNSNFKSLKSFNRLFLIMSTICSEKNKPTQP
jgi:hypothetical protein